MLFLLIISFARPPILLTIKRGEIDFVDLSALSGSSASAHRESHSPNRESAAAPPKKKWFDFSLSPKGEFASSDSEVKPSTRPSSQSGLKPMADEGTSADKGDRENYRENGNSQNPFAKGRENAATGTGDKGTQSGDKSAGNKGEGQNRKVEWDEKSLKRELVLAPAFVLPEELQGRGIRADVTCEIGVDPEGRVLNPVIQQSSGIAELDRAVLENVRRYQFKALDEGRTSYGTIRFTFLY
ncbi:MAG: energy transducer TonB [Spirochaetia bacterium]|nr:energy transducer TonB [Spirochaetia bacterium]